MARQRVLLSARLAPLPLGSVACTGILARRSELVKAAYNSTSAASRPRDRLALSSPHTHHSAAHPQDDLAGAPPPSDLGLTRAARPQPRRRGNDLPLRNTRSDRKQPCEPAQPRSPAASSNGNAAAFRSRKSTESTPSVSQLAMKGPIDMRAVVLESRRIAHARASRGVGDRAN
jgi:hypothetical protein